MERGRRWGGGWGCYISRAQGKKLATIFGIYHHSYGDTNYKCATRGYETSVTNALDCGLNVKVINIVCRSIECRAKWG